MRLAMRLPPRKGEKNRFADSDPRENESAEIIDLASRNGFPAVVDRKGKSDGLGLAAGVAIVGLLGATTFWAMQSARIAEPQPIGNASVSAPQPAAAPAPIGEPVAAPQEAYGQSDPGIVPVLAHNPAASIGPAANPYASPTVIFDASTGAQGNRLVEAPAPVTGAVAPGVGDSGAGGDAAAFASRIGGVGGGTAQAQAMTNPSTTVTQGTLIPAILETAINTNVPGYVRAVVSQDVRSFDGKRVLVPRSSRLIGQYQSGVQNGQKRAYVIWTRLIRPDGASVNIASPAIGFDGTTGLAGDVDNHFFKRFGSALLLSVVGGLGAVASGGASVVIGGAGQSAANTALQQDGAIGPTIRVKMGEPIRVFTARDLDFSTVQ